MIRCNLGSIHQFYWYFCLSFCMIINYWITYNMELYIVHILGGSEEREWPVLLDLCKDISNHLWFSCQRAETYEEFVVKHYLVSSRNWNTWQLENEPFICSYTTQSLVFSLKIEVSRMLTFYHWCSFQLDNKSLMCIEY